MADVTDFTTWSSTAASNQPQGGTSIGTNLDDNLRQIQAEVAKWRDGIGYGALNVSSVAGTNTITGTTSPAPTLASGQKYSIIPANTNTGATTFNPNSSGAKNVFLNGAALVGNEIKANSPIILQYDGTQFNIVAGTFPTKQGSYGSNQIFTSSGTWTKPSGLAAVEVTVVGGGAGAAAAGATGGAPAASAGSGGGAGATSIKYILASALGATETVTVGAGGATDVNGGKSSFGAHCTATGGTKGVANALSAGSSIQYTSGGPGGTATNGDVNISGGQGGPSMTCTINNNYGLGGYGGSSLLGAGGSAVGFGVTALAGTGYGSGGGGSANSVSAGAISGGAGAGGIVIVKEFY